ncbi:MAG: Hpt domain-containing protein [Lachnospiraceae bacterium]|nr:Hpt domain-containing protein [Lachnospiraceae bacterium]
MTVRECYDLIGDYDRVYACFHNDEKIAKFLKMFLADENYKKLSEALAAGDVDTAFLAAHTLKGVCQNLALDDLYNADVQVTEALRGNDLLKARELFPDVEREYTNVELAIKGLV